MFAIDHCQIQDPDLLATGEPSIDVEGRARDPVSAADLFGLGPGLVLPQYPDDLLLAEAAPSHRPSPFSGDGLYLISEEFSGCRPGCRPALMNCEVRDARENGLAGMAERSYGVLVLAP